MPITKQTVAIIGADSPKGSNIAKSICQDNYRLLLISDDISKIQPLAKEITQTNASSDIDVRDCQFDACWEADIIVMAVPCRAHEEVAGIIEKVATQKIVISTANRTNEASEELEISAGARAAEKLQNLLPNSKIVRAFNTVTAVDFNLIDADRKPIDISIAANDEEALKIVSELTETAGFNPEGQ